MYCDNVHNFKFIEFCLFGTDINSGSDNVLSFIKPYTNHLQLQIRKQN